MEQPAPKPTPPPSVIKFNLLLLLGGAVVGASLAPLTDGGTAVLFGLGFLVQAGINFLLALANLRKGPAPYLLSAVLVLLLGFGACAGMMGSGLVPLNFH